MPRTPPRRRAETPRTPCTPRTTVAVLVPARARCGDSTSGKRHLSRWTRWAGVLEGCRACPVGTDVAVLDGHAVHVGEEGAECADDELSLQARDDEALALFGAEGVAQCRRADALLGGAPDGDAEADEDGDRHDHFDHDLGFVAQAAEGAPVRSDPADNGVDVSLVGRKEHVSHRPCWVVPHPLRACRGQASLSPTNAPTHVDLASLAGVFCVNEESYRHSVYHGMLRRATKPG